MTDRPAYALAIHGGAGAIRREEMTPAQEAAFRSAKPGDRKVMIYKE